VLKIESFKYKADGHYVIDGKGYIFRSLREYSDNIDKDKLVHVTYIWEYDYDTYKKQKEGQCQVLVGLCKDLY